jgi:hypothetical protein
MKRRCQCGNMTTVRDYDEAAVCVECQEETARMVREVDHSGTKAAEQRAAKFVAERRGLA